MARQVLPFVGAAVGFVVGGPTGAQIGFTLGAIVGNAVDPQVIQGPKLGDAGLQTSAEGVIRPIVFGTGAVKGNVIARGNRQVVTQRTQQGKGGGPVVEQQRVYWTFAIRLTEAPSPNGIGGVTRIWQDEKLVYDITMGSTIPAESAQFAERFRLYLGDEDQLPDPDLEAFQGIGNTPAYRGTSYIVFPNFDLTDRRESIPDFRFEISNQPAMNNYAFLLHMDEVNESEEVIDEVVTNEWSNSVGLVSSPVVFGAAAIEIKQPADCPITLTDFASIIGTQDFCISGWIYRDSTGIGLVYDCILGHWYAAGTRSFQFYAWRVDYENLAVALSNDGTAIVDIVGNIPVPYDEYVYVAVTREAGTVKLWQQISPTQCIEVGSGSFPFALKSNFGEIPGQSWMVGGFDQVPNQNTMYGYIDELVMIVGDPVYTEAFSPPSAPWPNPASAESSSVGLDDIVSFLHVRAGHTNADYNVAELTDEVEGLVLAFEGTSADAIRTLMPIYFFDSSEYDAGSGYRVNYSKRGKPVVTTLTVDQLIDAPEKSTREDALERPRKLHLHYQNPTIGYAPAKATAARNSPDILVVGEKAIQVPVSYTNVDEPAQIVDKLMKVTTAEVGGIEEFTIHDGLLSLVPSDCVGVSLRGQTRRMRIVEQFIGAGTISLKMIADRQSAYTSNVTGVPVPEPTPPLPSIVGETVYEFMDLPALNDNNDRLLWYDAASGQTPAWYGAQTQHKAGADVEFQNSALFTQNTIMGTLVDPVASASPYYTDTTNVVRVQLYTDDVIDSLTIQQFLSEGGSFAIKNADETWEILQYKDAEDEGGGVFALTHLARGRLNTNATAHLVGASFVLLDSVQSVDAITAWIDTPIVNRAVSLGSSPDTAPQYTDQYTALSQTEFPVAHLFLDLVGDDLTATTVPRHRFGTEDNPIRSINWTGYRWTATDGANTLTVDTLADTTTFDVTGWASPITVTVAQLNRFTGPGPSVSEQI